MPKSVKTGMLAKAQYDITFLLTKSGVVPGSFSVKWKKVAKPIDQLRMGIRGSSCFPFGLADPCFELCPS